MLIRSEEEADRARVHAINVAAFGGPEEADLVDRLRAAASPIVSLVAEDQGLVIGHIMFSPVTPAEAAGVAMMGLAPMAVAPGRQRQGVGSQLVRAGLEQCRQLGCGAVVVLGHPDYYPRFGFVPASRFGIHSEYDAPDEAFMALELAPGALRNVDGVVRYHATFAGI